ncbi:hypothetical protein BW716_24220 [[Flexibacter] sp. ATCC 35208]|nr:hypothetical protein BW716_24220 [[Flexibacter] sp. ATCC 35208]
MNLFTTPPLSIEEQIELLQQKGLNILPEDDLARNSNLIFYSLSIVIRILTMYIWDLLKIGKRKLSGSNG